MSWLQCACCGQSWSTEMGVKCAAPCGCAEAERQRFVLTEALLEIADTPAFVIVGEGRDRHGRLDGHKKCVAIARAALDKDAAAAARDASGGRA